MKLPNQPAALAAESGFSLVEVLVAAVIFAGTFLMLFTLLGRLLANSSGADYLRAASIADIRIAQFHAGLNCPNGTELVDLDGIRFRVLTTTVKEMQRETLRLIICRESTSDSVAIIYGIRYVRKE